ncbi:hypothetical protein OVY01_08125 [Robbsia sp. Bb-Pol-6]|uniref:Uncharacterized protein n=1 Tax=Robbsia betulipollinis TaxID=2981849 RepID=A0ABT3ZML6_9BURK|nr:hypothetical protein [Robbsia betulipollinis]MCY0387198.1 hypothetical protein [Robbsia betulipollinis]
MLSIPATRGLYSLIRGLSGRSAARSRFAPPEGAPPGTFRSLSPFSEQTSDVSQSSPHAISSTPRASRPPSNFAIRRNPLFIDELRKRIASVKNSSGDTSQTDRSRPGNAGRERDVVQDKTAAATIPARIPTPAADLAPLTSPALVLSQQRVFEAEQLARRSTAPPSAALLPANPSQWQRLPIKAPPPPFHVEAIPAGGNHTEILRTWSVEELRDMDRITRVARTLSSVDMLCHAASEKTREMSDAALAIDLSRVFGGKLFTPDEVRKWRRDITTMYNHASLFSAQREKLVAFTHLSHDRMRVERRSPAAIGEFMKKHEVDPSLIITDAFFDDSEAHCLLQILRAVTHGTGRRETLTFPLHHNQDAVSLSASPRNALHELEAFCRAGLRVHGNLLRGNADADIDRNAVRFGKHLPDDFTGADPSEGVKKEALKLVHRGDRRIEQLVKTNCDSLVLYALRCATSGRDHDR